MYTFLVKNVVCGKIPRIHRFVHTSLNTFHGRLRIPRLGGLNNTVFFLRAYNLFFLTIFFTILLGDSYIIGTFILISSKYTDTNTHGCAAITTNRL